MFAYIGCRTTKERNARGQGISLVRHNEQTGKLELIKIETGWLNPSYLTINQAKTRLYSIHGDGHEVSAFAIDSISGQLTPINTQDTQGKNPVHLALSPNDKQLIVSNHLSSNIAVMPLISDGTNDGAIGEVSQLITLSGTPGPHRHEQPFAKPHFNPFDPSGRFVIIPDKGLDKVFSFPFKAGQLLESEKQVVEARETSGPRNIVFHPSKPWAYVINELDSTVTYYQFESTNGRLTPLQICSVLADTFIGNSRASSIQIASNGKTLYASNRGEDSIAVMRIDQGCGRIELIQSISSYGKTPRFFTLSPNGRWLYVLNEDSDSIVTLAIDSNGKLSKTKQTFHSGSPTCMVFLT